MFGGRETRSKASKTQPTNRKPFNSSARSYPKSIPRRSDRTERQYRLSKLWIPAHKKGMDCIWTKHLSWKENKEVYEIICVYVCVLHLKFLTTRTNGTKLGLIVVRIGNTLTPQGFHFPRSVITTWQMREIMRWDQCEEDLYYVPEGICG